MFRYTIPKDMHLHIGRAAIVAMGNGIHNSLPEGTLGQFQPLVSPLGMGNEGGIQLGLKIAHDLLVEGIEIPAKLFAVEDMGLGASLEDGAGYAGLEGEPGNVIG